MTDVDTTQIKQHAFGSSNASPSTYGKGDDLTGTADMLELGKKKKARAKAPAKKTPKKKTTPKNATEVARPTQTIEAAIQAGVPPKQLDKLLKDWGKYNLQQAAIKAKEATEAMASSIQDRRRKIADELLKLADSHGITMMEARKMFDEAIEAERNGKTE